MKSEQAPQKLTEVLRRKHFALKTEQCYCAWLKRYCEYVKKLPALLPSEQKLERFLTALAKNDVAASTRNQALNARHPQSLPQERAADSAPRTAPRLCHALPQSRGQSAGDSTSDGAQIIRDDDGVFAHGGAECGESVGWLNGLNWYFGQRQQARPAALKGVPPLSRTDLGAAGWEAALIGYLRQRGRSWRTERDYRERMWRFEGWLEGAGVEGEASPGPGGAGRLAEAGGAEVRAFLTLLASERRVSVAQLDGTPAVGTSLPGRNWRRSAESPLRRGAWGGCRC